jgi:hypothetical protein
MKTEPDQRKHKGGTLQTKLLLVLCTLGFFGMATYAVQAQTPPTPVLPPLPTTGDICSGCVTPVADAVGESELGDIIAWLGVIEAQLFTIDEDMGAGFAAVVAALYQVDDAIYTSMNSKYETDKLEAKNVHAATGAADATFADNTIACATTYAAAAGSTMDSAVGPAAMRATYQTTKKNTGPLSDATAVAAMAEDLCERYDLGFFGGPTDDRYKGIKLACNF